MVDKIANLTFIKAIKVGTNDFSEVSNAVMPNEICWVMKVIRVGGSCSTHWFIWSLQLDDVDGKGTCLPFLRRQPGACLPVKAMVPSSNSFNTAVHSGSERKLEQ